MNKIKATIIGLLITGLAFSSMTDEMVKESISERAVPSDVRISFERTNKNIESKKWYPYPYRFSFSQDINDKAWFSPVVNLSTAPDFYEVEYLSNGKTIRKIYDLKGDCEQKVTVMSVSEASEQLVQKLAETGFDLSSVLNYEIVSGCGYDNFTLYKFLVKKDQLTSVIYFNENYELEKSREWSVQNFTSTSGNVKVKTAYQGNRSKVEIQDLTWDVRLKLKEDFNQKNILEYWESEPVHVPQQREVLEYYDIHLSPIYEVVFKASKSQILKNSYDAKGKLVEQVELIELENSPNFVKEAIMAEEYKNWNFENSIEKVFMKQGEYCYRIHATANGKNQVFVINNSK